MKLHVLTLVAVCNTLLAGTGWGQNSKDIEKELQPFQGSWKAISMHHPDGRQTSQDEVANTHLVIEGNKFRLLGKDHFVVSGTFFINPVKSPKTIDVVLTSKDGRETRFLGIYQVQGEQRKSCFGLAGKERPTRFSYEKGCFGYTWERDPFMDLFMQAQKLIAQGKPAEALKAFEKASALEPDNELAVVGQYISLVKLNRQDDGAKVLDKWVQAKPNDPRRWNCKGICEAQTGQPEKALKSFEKLCVLEPQEGANWVGKGQMLSELKRYEDALKAFDKAITLSPKHEAAWNNRGGVLLRLGKYEEAIESLDKAVELRPQWAASWYDRACAYALKGEKAKALPDLRKALELQPSLKAQAAKDPDFKSLRGDSDFHKLTGAKPIQ